MIYTNDIYSFIGIKLYQEGCKDIRLVPVKKIEELISQFLEMKINDLNSTLDNEAKLRILENLVEGQPNEEQVMGNFVFYILWYIGMLQGFSISWQIEDIETPYFKDSKFMLGKIDSLVTSKNINYIETFKFVLEKAKEMNPIEERGRE